jgi:hypothetical protein
MKNERKEQTHSLLVEVAEVLYSSLEAQESRFPSYKKLLSKCRSCILTWEKGMLKSFSGINEIINEMCGANLILLDSRNRCLHLEYEPPLKQGKQSIDFRALVEDGHIVYWDFKTIHPDIKDVWSKFEETVIKGRFPDRVNVILNPEFLGGEIWHDMYASRTKMLEYTIELEQKIKNCERTEKTSFVMVFCNNGFRWHLDELEDFVDFYLSGRHNPDDPFAKMEDYFIKEKNIYLSRSIDCFAYLERQYNKVKPTCVVSNVRGPWQ